MLSLSWFFTLVYLVGGGQVLAGPVEYRISAMSNTEYHQNIKDLHCADWNNEFVLCPLVVNDNAVSFTNAKTVPSSTLLMEMRRSSTSVVKPDRYVFQASETFDANEKLGYWATGQQDGWDAAGWLHPQGLEEIAGGPVLVAQPARGMFCFWPKLSTQLHKNMAVGVQQAYENAKHPVSPKIYQWDAQEEVWSVWGQALPTDKSDKAEKNDTQ